METIIQTDHLSRHFKDTIAVDQLTLEIKRGEIFGLLGHNGAGKTTTVRLLNGILNPTSGSANVLGFTPHLQGDKLRKHTGVLTETPALYEQLSAKVNLRIFGEIYNLDNVNQRVDAILAQFNLTDRADEKVGGYSKGMKQRLALARAFLHEPELLFLDEPTAGLDPIASRQVNDSILALSHHQNRTVILATHNLHDAQQLCDRIAILEHGKLMLVGNPTELARETVQTREVVFHINPSQLDHAQPILERHASALTTEAETGTITASNLYYEDIPQIIHELSQADVMIYQVTPQQPTLEDVYFALHKEKAV
jgi:ABC-2 type transport system ATP-binding protein